MVRDDVQTRLKVTRGGPKSPAEPVREKGEEKTDFERYTHIAKSKATNSSSEVISKTLGMLEKATSCSC